MNAQTLWVPIKVPNSTTHSALDRKTIAAARITLAQAPPAPCYGNPNHK